MFNLNQYPNDITLLVFNMGICVCTRYFFCAGYKLECIQHTSLQLAGILYALYENYILMKARCKDDMMGLSCSLIITYITRLEDGRKQRTILTWGHSHQLGASITSEKSSP